MLLTGDIGRTRLALRVTIAANIGDTTILGLPACFPDSIVGFTPYPGVSDVVFVKYMLDLVKQHFTSISSGATQDNLSLEKLLSQDLWAPAIDEQCRIASILGAYDDLIEVNRRRVAVLEAMARGLFEEWFVRFRFPGHENNKIIETPESPLPEGWTLSSIGALAAYINRGIPPKYDPASSTLVIGQRCIRDGKLDLGPARNQSKAAPVDKTVRTGDVLINSTGIGTLGRIAQAESVPFGLTVDSHVTIARPDAGIDPDYFGHCLLGMQAVFEHLGAGSTGQTELARGTIASQPVFRPKEGLHRRFGTAVRPMRRLAFELQGYNVGLAASRDLLLPRLISGDLSVAAAERQLEAAA